jgi:hypothetical protein|tara:strand:+ start:137 stop:325 length:189 start_codon:yes stop_codon:yes gene_type:complete
MNTLFHGVTSVMGRIAIRSKAEHHAQKNINDLRAAHFKRSTACDQAESIALYYRCPRFKIEP